MMLAAGTTTAAVALNNRVLASTELGLINTLHPSDLVHTSQAELNGASSAGSPSARFTLAFDRGDQEFSHQFSAAEGGGANVGDGGRYSRMPRADLKQAGQWVEEYRKFWEGSLDRLAEYLEKTKERPGKKGAA